MVNKVELWPLYIKTNRDVLVFEGRELLKEENRYKLVIKQYRTKLIELGAMREIKNFAQTLNGKYTKKGVKKLEK